ncbi:MAG: ABC transporter substrate-binding protein, partial [Chloroflexi bacterium]|nr:ABC transporter substrate-binding protein [Chloroflexota bacterium]
MISLLGTSFRIHTKRLPATGTFVLLLALILAACGGGEEATPTSQATPVPQTEVAEEAPPTTEVTEETPPPTEVSEETPPPEETPTEEVMTMERTGTLRVAMQPIVNIDPIAISSDSEVLVANHVYDYLVDIDPQSNPAPRLATSWESSEDGLTWVFTLAEGVTWHDGSEFSAEDVVWTFDRLRNTEGAPTADLYANVASVEATGDLEVTFTLQEPNPFFLYDLSDNHALVLKAGTEDADTNFNGTGPFVVTNYTPEDRIVMEANANYFVEGQPHLAGLEIIFFNDEAAAVEALRGGQIDLVMRMSTALFTSLQGE